MTPETGKISEIYPGVFSVLLWAPTTALFSQLLDPSHPCVLVWQHQTGRFAWEPFLLPVIEPASSVRVFGRSALFDFVASTDDFVAMASRLKPAIRAVQLHAMPPDCLDMTRINSMDANAFLCSPNVAGICSSTHPRMTLVNWPAPIANCSSGLLCCTVLIDKFSWC